MIGECPRAVAGELSVLVGNVAPVTGARVSSVWRDAYGQYRVTVCVRGRTHRVLAPRFGSHDDGTTFRLAAIDVLAEGFAGVG